MVLTLLTVVEGIVRNLAEYAAAWVQPDKISMEFGVY